MNEVPAEEEKLRYNEHDDGLGSPPNDEANLSDELENFEPDEVG